ncbi:MAG: phosphate/phosphite/phosphonate ABC transporter substrate-binding protein [Gammaproteobacteria bacterium]|nr:phosphate/phosphite/phosphonate ABC transporter substrate-binding protein [Gammaproteobacteria bacterium]
MIFCTLSSTYALADSINEKNNCSKFGPIKFGILPFISTEQLVERFTPLAHYLSKHLDVAVRIETAPNFMEFSRRTQKDQRYDILFTAPHFYPKANTAGYRLIASVDSSGMRAIIVVPKKSNIQNINDLTGKRLATLHPMGLSSLLIRKYLSTHNINPDIDLTMISTPTHDASLLSSYHGITDASALMEPPYEATSSQIRDSMRIIAKTEKTPHIPISVSPKINESCANTISDLLLNMDSTIDGQNVLKHNQFPGFRQAKDEEYEKVRDLLEH